MSFDFKKFGIGVGLIGVGTFGAAAAIVGVAGVIVSTGAAAIIGTAAYAAVGAAITVGAVTFGVQEAIADGGKTEFFLGAVSTGLALVAGALLLGDKAEVLGDKVEAALAAAAPAIKQTASAVAPMTGIVTYEGDFNAPSLAKHFHADDILSVPTRSPVQSTAPRVALALYA